MIAKSRKSFKAEDFDDIAEQLLNRDESEDGNLLGQHIGKTFHLSNIFLKEDEALEAQLRRITEILFSHPFRTPTLVEFGMFMARATALRSSDLSRQVGAVIMTETGEINAVGCNEVPLSGGGFFWETITNKNKSEDHRDHKVGYDSTSRKKKEILEELVGKFVKNGIIDQNALDGSIETFVEDLIFGERKNIIDGTRITSILEFGRIVHAEMSAITEAARRGLPTAGTSLYCTTFPCHMCARHIIAAGIRRVVYIEPYPKSLAKELYKEQLKLEGETDTDDAAVAFEPFVGVAPRRYLEFFDMVGRRKDERGYKVKWPAKEQIPRVRMFPAYTQIETGYIKFLNENRVKLGLVELRDENEGDDHGEFQ